MEETQTIWVCQCCTLMQANGECCADDSHGGDGIEPWSLPLSEGQRVTIGLLAEHHDDECDGGVDCNRECETNNFSTSSCDGCGSSLHGERHAFTLWYPSA